MGELHLPKGVIFRQERSSVVTVPAKVDVCWVAVVFITERRNSFLTNIGFQGQEFGFRKAFTNLYKKRSGNSFLLPLRLVTYWYCYRLSWRCTL